MRRIEADAFAKPLTAPRLATRVMMEKTQRSLEQARCIGEAGQLDPRMAQVVAWAEEFAQGMRRQEDNF